MQTEAAGSLCPGSQSRPLLPQGGPPSSPNPSSRWAPPSGCSACSRVFYSDRPCQQYPYPLSPCLPLCPGCAWRCALIRVLKISFRPQGFCGEGALRGPPAAHWCLVGGALHAQSCSLSSGQATSVGKSQHPLCPHAVLKVCSARLRVTYGKQAVVVRWFLTGTALLTQLRPVQLLWLLVPNALGKSPSGLLVLFPTGRAGRTRSLGSLRCSQVRDGQAEPQTGWPLLRVPRCPQTHLVTVRF